MSLATIKSSITALSQQERAELMHFMVDVMAEESLYLSDIWKKELDKRESDLERKISVGKPISEVLKKYTRS